MPFDGRADGKPGSDAGPHQDAPLDEVNISAVICQVAVVVIVIMIVAIMRTAHVVGIFPRCVFQN